jgi:zinc protease
VADRTRLPALTQDAPFTFPAIRKASLENGLAVWTVQHRNIPVQTMVLLVRVGSSSDPDERPGLASLTGDMLDEGAGDRGALELNEALAKLGGQFDTEVGPDATFLTLTTLSRFKQRAFELIADIVARPQFSAHEFDRVRQLRGNRLRQLRDVPSAVADRAFASALYGSHPYGHLAIGTMSALEAVTLPEVVDFHRRAFRPSRAVLVVVGDAPHEEILDAATKAFGGWREQPSAGPPLENAAERVLQLPPAPASRLLLVDRPGAAQSELRIGHVGVSRRTPDYHALLLLNLVLGGQFVSRLNMNLREHNGFTYGARSWFEFRLGPGPFQMSASVQTEVSADAIREALEEVRVMRSERPVTQEELDVARASLTRGYPRNFETADQVARSVAQLALYDLPDDYFAIFVPRIEALGLEAIQDAGMRHLDADRLMTLVVGDREKVLPTLASLGVGEPALIDMETFPTNSRMTGSNRP